MYKGTLGADMTPTTAASNVGSLAACDAKPFGQKASVSYYTSYNKLKLSGKSGESLLHQVESNCQ